MVRAYEALYVVHPEISEEQIEAAMDKFKQVAEEQGAEVEGINRWEKRRLAYEVKGQREGIYILMNFKGEAKVADELNRLFKIDEQILRHVIVRLDEQ